MDFLSWLENIDYNQIDVIVPKGTVLYHGTLESFDTRKPRTGGYDEVFWTADDIMIARSYIPSKGLYSNVTVEYILRDPEYANVRKSLGISDGIIRLAWQKQEKNYQNYRYWNNKEKEFEVLYRQYEKSGDASRFELLNNDFFDQWIQAEMKAKELMRNLRSSEDYLKSFVIHKMKSFGYDYKQNGYFKQLTTDENGYLRPFDHKDVGKVLKVTCLRDFRMYNYAYNREGDLMNPDYYNLEMFRKVELKGYDGVIINDFAQTDYYGNYGHRSVGFFKNSIKDLKINQIRNQTHPNNDEWN